MKELQEMTLKEKETIKEIAEIIGDDDFAVGCTFYATEEQLEEIQEHENTYVYLDNCINYKDGYNHYFVELLENEGQTEGEGQTVCDIYVESDGGVA